MFFGPLALAAFILIAAVLLDLGIVQWLRRRGQGNPEHRALPAPPWLRALIAQPAGSPPAAAGAGQIRAAPLLPSLVKYLRAEILQDRVRRMRLLAALGGLVVSTGIGLRYAGSVMVSGWQLWVWIAAVLVTTFALMPPGRPAIPRGLPWAWLGGLLVAAIFLRGLFLGTVPGWLHPDEAGLANYTLLHVFPRPGFTVSPFVTGSAVQPTLHSYILSLVFHTIGRSITALRIPSVVAGTLAILATYAAIASIESRRVAILAAAIMTTYHFHIHWSRLALNNIWDTLWVPLVLAAFAWGWKRKWSGGAVLSGLAVGFSQYFYAGNKISLFLLAILVYSLWKKDPDRRRLGVHLGKLATTAGCIAAPLGAFALFNPRTYFSRVPVVMGWYPEAVREITGRVDAWWEYFWHQAGHSFGAYVAYPDVTGFYRPGIPLLFGLASLVFLVGVFVALDTRRWIPLVWVALTAVLGGFIMRGAPSSSHFVVSIPGIVWLVALPLDALIARGRWKLALALTAAIMVSDLVFYFGVYVPASPADLTVPFPTPPPPGG
jgi:hypothetical protein